MKQFSCGQVIPGCAARFEAETEDEPLGQVAAHAKADHDIDPVPADVVDTVRSLITSS